MKSSYRRVLEKLVEEDGNFIVAECLVPTLHIRGVLTRSEAELVNHEITTVMKNKVLFSFLSLKSDEVYDVLIDIFRYQGWEDRRNFLIQNRNNGPEFYSSNADGLVPNASENPLLNSCDRLEKKDIENEIGHMEEALGNELKCNICFQYMINPYFCATCRRLVGCQMCVNEWLKRQSYCNHCRGPSNKLTKVLGLENFGKKLREIEKRFEKT